MPFTLSHAAAVLPALRRDGTARGPLLASGLVLGSIAPDMTYFAASVAPAAMEFGEVTHGLPGVLTVDAAVAGVLLLLWLLVRGPLVALLPAAVRARTHPVLRGDGGWRGRGPWAFVWRFWLSASLGAATHVVWDAFTHFDRWGVRLFPVLGEAIGGFPLYTYTQYGSSAVALAVLGWWAVSAVRRAEPVPVPGAGRSRRRAAVAFLGTATAVGAVHRCVTWLTHGNVVENPLDIVPTLCFGAGAGLAAGLVLYGAAARAGFAPGGVPHRAGFAPGTQAGTAAGAGAGTAGAPAVAPPPPASPDAEGAPVPQCAADSQSAPTPTETSSGARSVTADDIS
ncbi:DUF4184 family protein [Streptomyces sp. NPDC005805]|uniref:DUF4184 family protein n=1 Tax=Streptomyces sp. NPDC005805 TaxID=3157068 RepID=UPI0033DD0AFD